jgi:hypothetical protein
MATKKTAGPQTKPFEIRTGTGLPGFRGMQTEGDASAIPPTKFRYLQNVRVGDGDIKSRPGLAGSDTLAAPAAWLTEVDEDVQGATIYYGPNSTYLREWYYDQGPPPQPILDQIMSHLYSSTDMSRMTLPSDVTMGIAASILYGLMPHYDANSVLDANQNVLAPCGANPYTSSEGVGPWPAGPVEDHTGWEANTWTSGIHALGFFQVPLCVDVMIPWTDREGNRRWLAAGHHRGDRWSGVGDYECPYYSLATGGGYVAAAGDPDVGGQSLVEVTFDTKKDLDRRTLLGYLDGAAEPPLYPAGITELARLPPPGYKRGCRVWGPAPVPTASFDPEMYPNGEWIRSMVAVGRRADDLLDGNEYTQETVYIGTAGGKVLAIAGEAGGGAPDNTVRWGINDPTDGAVWAFDGVSLEKVVSSGVGASVMVAKLPDGGVLAAGRTGAEFLPEKGASWQTVTYSPNYTTPGGSNYADTFNYGFFWTDRRVYQGRLYLIGYDAGAGYVAGNASLNNPDRLVIYRFDVSALTLTRVRVGSAFDQASGNNLDGGVFTYQRFSGQQSGPIFATSGAHLYYMTRWVGFGTHIGRFDGSLWDDDWIEVPGSSGQYAAEMVYANRLIYVAAGNGTLWTISPAGVVTGPYFFSASGADWETKVQRLFLGP